MSANLAALLVFFGLAASLGMGVLAFSGAPSPKKFGKRLEAIRERHSTSREVYAKAQMKRIVAARSKRFDTFHGLIPRREQLAARLDRTGRSWSVGGYGAACAATAIITFTACLTLGLPALIALLVSITAGVGGPHLFTARLIAKRSKAFNGLLPDAIDLLVRGLRSGLPVTESLGVVGREVADPVGLEFRSIADKIRIGRSMDMALNDTADRLDSPEFRFFVIALAIQRETGGNLAETLTNLGEVLRKRAQIKLKINAMSSEAKASAYIIGALPFCVFTMMYFISPGYLAPFFTDTRLMVAAGVGGVWMSIGAGVMAKMVKFRI